MLILAKFSLKYEGEGCQMDPPQRKLPKKAQPLWLNESLTIKTYFPKAGILTN